MLQIHRHMILPIIIGIPIFDSQGFSKGPFGDVVD